MRMIRRNFDFLETEVYKKYDALCDDISEMHAGDEKTAPDLLRMNNFEVSVDIKIQQIEDQDGARCFWIQNYTPEQAKAKLLA